jgi:phage-related tail protein
MKSKIFIAFTFMYLGVLMSAKAQFQPKKFKDNYKDLAQKETNTMKSRYHLNSVQLQKVEKLNQDYYAEINNTLETNKDRIGRKKAVDQVREKREQQLKLLFTKIQYTAYRKDMDAVEVKAQQRVNELNRNMPKQRLRLKN